MQTVRVTTPSGWSTSRSGSHKHYPPGDYKVPDEMSPDEMATGLQFGKLILVRTKDTKLQTKRKKSKRRAKK